MNCCVVLPCTVIVLHHVLLCCMVLCGLVLHCIVYCVALDCKIKTHNIFCLPVSHFVCPKFSHCFVLSILKSVQFLTSCVFYLNASSHLCFCCIGLCCIGLCCIVLCSIVLCSIALYCVLLYCIVKFVFPPETECGCIHGGVIENGRACNALTLCSVPVLVHVQVWVHIPGNPQCSAEERYFSFLSAFLHRRG